MYVTLRHLCSTRAATDVLTSYQHHAVRCVHDVFVHINEVMLHHSTCLMCFCHALRVVDHDDVDFAKPVGIPKASQKRVGSAPGGGMSRKSVGVKSSGGKTSTSWHSLASIVLAANAVEHSRYDVIVCI